MTLSKSNARELLVPALMWGLVFLGWGVDNLGGFFSHRARVGLAVVGLTAGIFVLVSIPNFDPFRKGQQPVGRQRTWRLLPYVY